MKRSILILLVILILMFVALPMLACAPPDITPKSPGGTIGDLLGIGDALDCVNQRAQGKDCK